MSVAVSDYVWKNTKQQGARLLVLLALADNADEGGWSRYSVANIAAKARQKPTATRNYLSDLFADGEIVIYGRKLASGLNSSNLYRVNFPGATEKLPEVAGEIVARAKPEKRKAKSTGKKSSTPKKQSTQEIEGTPKNGEEGTPKNGESDPSVDPSITDNLDESRMRVKYGSIFSLYENAIGMITELIKPDLIEAAETYPDDWITEAFKLAVTNNKRRWSYVNRILTNWKDHGRDYKPWTEKTPKPSANGSAPKPTPSPAPEPVEEMDPALRYPSQMFARIRKQLEAEGVKVP